MEDELYFGKDGKFTKESAMVRSIRSDGPELWNKIGLLWLDHLQCTIPIKFTSPHQLCKFKDY